MDERKILARLRRGDSMALAWIIEKYTPYLYAIAEGVMGEAGSAADKEEVVSESFIALWYSRDKVKPGKLKAYLAAIVRNKAVSRLRAMKLYEPLEDDMLIVSCRDTEYRLLQAELSELAKAAVDSLPEPDREIFKRHYFLYEKTEHIAVIMGLKPATVRTKLARGRRRLKNYLMERGYGSENLFD